MARSWHPLLEADHAPPTGPQTPSPVVVGPLGGGVGLPSVTMRHTVWLAVACLALGACAGTESTPRAATTTRYDVAPRALRAARRRPRRPPRAPDHDDDQGTDREAEAVRQAVCCQALRRQAPHQPQGRHQRRVRVRPAEQPGQRDGRGLGVELQGLVDVQGAGRRGLPRHRLRRRPGQGHRPAEALGHRRPHRLRHERRHRPARRHPRQPRRRDQPACCGRSATPARWPPTPPRAGCSGPSASRCGSWPRSTPVGSCPRPSSAYILSSMRPIAAHRWGLGTIGAGPFKGGWLRSDTVTRQMGIVDGYAVAIITDAHGPRGAPDRRRLGPRAADELPRQGARPPAGHRVRPG